jgi:hypothetical protein
MHSRWDRHDRLSVIGALTVSPVQKRVGFYFSMRPQNLTGAALLAFVQPWRGHLKRPLRVIRDRCSGQKKAARLRHDLYGTRIHVDEVPAYVPALKVVDHAWGHTTDGEMAHFIPTDLDDVADEVAASLLAKHRRPALLKAFFQHVRLDL